MPNAKIEFLDHKEIADIFTEASRTFAQIAESDYTRTVKRAAALIIEAFANGNKLLVFGNGGSSSDAAHICGELVGRFLLERRGLPAIALTENAAVVTAWANDYSYETIFSRQIDALGNAGDVAWGISTSGNSKNVVQGLAEARKLGLQTIGMTGSSAGKMGPLSDVLLCAPSKTTARIQEVHLVSYHAICAAVEQEMAARMANEAALVSA